MKAVNLLPGDLKPTSRQTTTAAVTVGPEADRPLGAYAVLAALALVVVAVTVLVLAGNDVEQREAELASAKVEQQSVAAEVARLASFGEFQALAANRVATVRSLAGSRFDWEQAMRDLSRSIPANVTLSDITGTVAPGASAGGGSGSNPLRTAIAKPAIELKGCTTDQRAVATLMARLRTVQGATRVALSKSTRAESAASGAGPSAGATTGGAGTAPKPVGCGLGAPADFEIVVFFESASASAADTGAAGGAAVAAPAAESTPTAGATPAAGAAPPAGATPVPTPSASSEAGGTTP